MRSSVSTIAILGALAVSTAFGQIKQTKEQILFYTSDWKGERFPDGRPKVADNLLTRALDVSIEDVWEYLRGQGYVNQFESGWQALHIEKPFAGRALTAQFAPSGLIWRRRCARRARPRGASAGAIAG